MTTKTEIYQFVNKSIKQSQKDSLRSKLDHLILELEVENKELYNNIISKAERMQSILEPTKQKLLETQQKLEKSNFTSKLSEIDKSRKNLEDCIDSDNIKRLKLKSKNISSVIERLEKVSSWEATLGTFESVVKVADTIESLNEAYDCLNLLKASVSMLQDFQGSDKRRKVLLESYSKLVQKFDSFVSFSHSYPKAYLKFSTDLENDASLPPILSTNFNRIKLENTKAVLSTIDDKIDLLTSINKISQLCQDRCEDFSKEFSDHALKQFYTEIKEKSKDLDALNDLVKIYNDLVLVISHMKGKTDLIIIDCVWQVQQKIYNKVEEPILKDLESLENNWKNIEISRQTPTKEINNINDFFWKLPEYLETLNLKPLNVEHLVDEQKQLSLGNSYLTQHLKGYKKVVAKRREFFSLQESDWLSRFVLEIYDKLLTIVLKKEVLKSIVYDFKVFQDVCSAFFDYNDDLIDVSIGVLQHEEDEDVLKAKFKELIENSL